MLCSIHMCVCAYCEASYLESLFGLNVSSTPFLLIQYKASLLLQEVLEQPFILSCCDLYA